MRWRHRSGKGVREIARYLRRQGASVFVTTQAGNGFPDIVVGWQGKTYLVEVKGSTSKSLTRKQREALGRWNGGEWVILRGLDHAKTWWGMLRRAQVKSGHETISVPDGTTTWEYSGVSVLDVTALGTPTSSFLAVSGGHDGDTFILRVSGSTGTGVTLQGDIASPLALFAGQAKLLYRSGGVWYAL